MPRPAPSPGLPPTPPGGPSRTPTWWRTGWARVGFVLAVPVLGFVNTFLGYLALLVAVVLLWRDNPWPKRWKAGATLAAVVLLGNVLPAAPQDKTTDTAAETDAKPRNAGGPADSPSPGTAGKDGKAPKPAGTPEIPDYRGQRLDQAKKQAQEAGFTVGDHDASDEGDGIWMRSNWTVCFQQAGTAPGGTRTMDFGAVHTGTPCPARDGGPIPWPRMPDLLDATWKTAQKTLAGLDVPPDHVNADAFYANDTLPDVGEYDDWKVCTHDPARQEPITDTTTVTLRLSAPENGCPTQAGKDDGGALLPDRDDDGDPDYHDPFPGNRDRNSTFPDGMPGTSGGSGSSSGGGGSSSGGSWGGSFGGGGGHWGW